MDLLKHISEGLAVLHNVKSLTITVVYTAFLWLLVVAAYVLVVRAFGIPQSQIPYSGAVFVMGLSMLGSVVPTPGGATGPFHAAAAASLVFLGVERNQAASAAIVLHLVIFLPAVFFGLFYLLKDGVTPGELMQSQTGALSVNPPSDLESLPLSKEAPVAVTQRIAHAAGVPAVGSAEVYRDKA
jgi:hypothetical protein